MEDIEDTSNPRLWKKAGWVARVIKNESDEGWAVAMTRNGDSEPALVSPWTMGRDKVNPKPLNTSDFASLLKGANDVLKRHEASLRAKMHKEGTCASETGSRLRVELDVATDEDDPHAILTVTDDRTDEIRRRGRVGPQFKLNESNVQKFIRTGGE
jgi:hypothetical protein